MNIKELNKLIKEELDAFLEAEDEDIQITTDEPEVKSGEEAIDLLRQIYDLIKPEIEPMGGDMGDEPDMDMGGEPDMDMDMDMGDESDMDMDMDMGDEGKEEDKDDKKKDDDKEDKKKDDDKEDKKKDDDKDLKESYVIDRFKKLANIRG